jgi:sulfatase maturation enzyme AslB (radical SAM superfamily)
MKGLNFETVIKWLTYLAERRNETGLQITTTFVKTTQSEEDIEAYYQYWERLGVVVGINELHSRGGFLVGVGSEKRTRMSCSIFNSRLFVAGNGDILACCNDLDGQSKLGTIGIDSLGSILGKKMTMIADEKLFPMCKMCNDHNVLP